MNADSIVVRTHVARDLLQSAAFFKNDRLVVWEYVSNSLQYCDPNRAPVVSVTLNSSRKCITVSDNGRGMDRAGLRNFFFMHGENLDRRAGRPGRGRFGTGKCAAFGIADCLRVTSIRDGKCNTVELRRSDIEAAGDGEIPVQPVGDPDVPTTEQNRTIVQIEGIRLRKLDQRGVMAYIERHLARWPGKPAVLVNNHECEYVEPPVAAEKETCPTGSLARELPGSKLILKVAKKPLDADLQGVAVFSRGVWLETTLAGAEGQPMSHYIFGEIDVPALDDDTSPIPAYDMSRSMRLNPNNPLVRAVLAFIGSEVDKLRRQLVEQERARKKQEETRKLEREGALIAKMINEDFDDFSDRLARVRAKAGSGRDSGPDIRDGADQPDVLEEGGDVPASVDEPNGALGRGEGHSGSGGEPPTLGPVLTPKDEGPASAKPAGGSGDGRRPRGGFRVEFKPMGEQESRAVYHRAERSIFVNLDHPQIAAAKGSAGVEDTTFRRLAYEVAFAEYSIALASEMVSNDEYIEPSEPVFDIRETLNRMARRAASLYED